MKSKSAEAALPQGDATSVTSYPAPARSIDPTAEARLLRKLDWHLLPWICIAYLINYLDRANLGNAKTLNSDVHGASLTSKVNLAGQRYSIVVAAFFVPYVLLEFPSNFFLKKYTPSRWIARIMLCWGIVTACQAAVTTYSGLIICRVFLGIAEAGFFPGCIYYLSFWYRPEERAQRMGIFTSFVAVSGAFSGLLATAISFLNGKGNLYGWQWLFILEAIPGIIMSVLIWFFMPDFPETAKFLTGEERSLLLSRMSEENPSANDANIDWTALRKTVMSSQFWLFAIAYFCMTNSLNASGYFLPTLISDIGFSGWRGQAMTVPPNVFACIIIIGNSVWSDKRKERILHTLGGLVIISLGYILLAATKTNAPRLVGCFLIVCTNAAVMPFLAFRMSTVSGHTATAIASGGTIAFANIGGITAPFLFADTSNYYRQGNYTVFALQILAALIVLYLWYRYGSSAVYASDLRSEDVESMPRLPQGADISEQQAGASASKGGDEVDKQKV